MNEIETIQSKLDRLAELQANADMIKSDAQEEIAALIPPEIQYLLQEIECSTDELDAAIQADIATLEADIKTSVLLNCVSVKGAHLHAIYTKGRPTWDGKMLDGMSKLIPQLEAARKVGEPTVSLRRI
jgi:hypothetical protein